MHHFFAWIGCIAVGIVRLLPLSVCFFIGQMLGLIAWIALPKRRRLAGENITRAFPDRHTNSQTSRLVLQHFITTGANFLSALKIPTLSEEQIRACSSVENKELIQFLLEQVRE